MMIRISDDFSAAARAPYGWELYQYKDKIDPQGNPGRKQVTTYHADLGQVLDAVIERSAGACADAQELRDLLTNARTIVRDCVATDRNR